MPVTSDCHYLFPAKVVSRLVKWVTIAHEDYTVGVGGGDRLSWELQACVSFQFLLLHQKGGAALLEAPTAHLPVLGNFQELHFTKDIVEAGLAGDTNLYYMALVERGTGNCPADDSGSR